MAFIQGSKVLVQTVFLSVTVHPLTTFNLDVFHFTPSTSVFGMSKSIVHKHLIRKLGEKNIKYTCHYPHVCSKKTVSVAFMYRSTVCTINLSTSNDKKECYRFKGDAFLKHSHTEWGKINWPILQHDCFCLFLCCCFFFFFGGRLQQPQIFDKNDLNVKPKASTEFEEFLSNFCCL